tara:strand:+ start:10165 stop:10941 length:777 start_codon:yes stop_codon:yes gene_type:complete
MSKDNLFSLEGKTALVTGAGSGLGQEIAKTLYEAGANLALAARRKEKLEETQSILDKKKSKIEIFSLDVTDESSIENCLNDIDQKFESIDLLINNAGMTVVGTLDSHIEDEWNNVINTNLRGPWALSKFWLKKRLEKNQNEGIIINVSSITGEAAQKGNGIYAISKAALSHMTRQMALEWAKHGVRVNAIAPGYFRTDLNSDFLDSDMSAPMIKRVPMRRAGNLEELKGPILLLATEAGSYITGSTIVVDGGHLVRDL